MPIKKKSVRRTWEMEVKIKIVENLYEWTKKSNLCDEKDPWGWIRVDEGISQEKRGRTHCSRTIKHKDKGKFRKISRRNPEIDGKWNWSFKRKLGFHKKGHGSSSQKQINQNILTQIISCTAGRKIKHPRNENQITWRGIIKWKD